MESIDVLSGGGAESRLVPLFWQHGESEAVLRGEIAKMDESGVGAFIAEARPHPDYLQDGWWRDLAILIDEAKKRGMKVWFFDDGSYPSGSANGLLAERRPDCVKRYLAENHIDAVGPRPGSSFFVGDWLGDGESLVRVAAAKRAPDRGDGILGETLTDVTALVAGGILYWDVPEGDWRVFVLKSTRAGGEDYTRNYLNPLDREPCRAFLDIVYEEHYRHFGEEFGKTVAGFFTDEPRFGNCATYDGRLGRKGCVLPWSDSLARELDAGPFGDFGRLLPCLWYDAGEVAPDARYFYMDAVTRRFGENFLGQIGDWCRAHGVKLIGHVVEENGAHARLGYGPGHYFRALSGLDNAGIDVVCNLFPGNRTGAFTTAFNFYDCDFNHWGLCKMASSAAHIDPKKDGTAMCEAFGAYGWTEGLKTMKWITDVMCVRGVNRITPHAFSPKEFPDPDCPPHFYARGHNPQFRFFPDWARYANRVCTLLSGGKHVAPAAVLYHAEAEWGGACEPFEKAVKALMLGQIDCDVLPADTLADEKACTEAGGTISVNGETYGALVVPWAEYLPRPLMERLSAFAADGFPVIFTRAFPKRCYFGGGPDTAGMAVSGCDSLVRDLTARGVFDIRARGRNETLSYCHYRKSGADLYFFVNEGVRETVDTFVALKQSGPAFLYDAMDGRCRRAEQRETPSGSEVRVRLEPYESVFVVFGARPGEPLERLPAFGRELSVDGEWRISAATAEEYPVFRPTGLRSLGNLAKPGLLPAFAGTLRYEIGFDCPADGPAELDLGELYELVSARLNGKEVGRRVCPPYRFRLEAGTLRAGTNRLQADVVNTLVKSRHDDPFDRYWPQEPTGLLGPVKLRF